MPRHESRAHRLPLAALLLGTALLGGCDMLGIETPGMVADRREAEGRAIGSACRHAVRSIEECHAAHPRISRAAILAGWREMDDHMRENNIEGMPARAPQALPNEAGQAPGEEVLPAAAAGTTPGAATAPTGATATPPTSPATAGTPPAGGTPGAAGATATPTPPAGGATPGTVNLPPRPGIAPTPPAGTPR